MANRGNREDAHIVLTEFDGTTTRFLLREKSRIQRGPTTGQGQITTVGESERRGDTRTPQVIWSDQTGGMGEFAYQEINGVTTFTDSELDTRYPGMLTLPPLATQISTMATVPTLPVHVEYLGQADAQVIAWQWAITSGPNAERYDPSPSGWTSVGFGNTTGFARFGLYFVFTRANSASSIRYSFDGSSWSVTAYANPLWGCCVHDGKFFAWDSILSRLVWTTDVTSAAGWSTMGSAVTTDGYVQQVLEWQRGGRTAVFVVTTRAIYWYDEDADVLHEFDNYGDLVDVSVMPWAHAWKRDGNLYLTFYNAVTASNTDTVLWYSGTSNKTGPNQRGGMLAASRVSLTHLVGNRRWLFAFGAPRTGTSNFGRVLAMTDNQGFHTLNVGTSGSVYVLGGGYGNGTLYTVLKDGKVYTQAVPDEDDLPLYATGRTYKTTTTYYHELAFTDLGSENLPLTALWVEIAARKMDTTYHEAGMSTSGSGVVEYMRDTDTGWTQLGTFGTSDAYPVRFAFRGGYGLMGNEIKIRVGIASSNSARSPVIAVVALAALREEAVRDAYACVVDLSRDSHVLYSGKSRAQLLTVLERLRQPGVLVKLQFAGGDDTSVPSTGRTITSCKVEWSGEEDAEEGPGLYSLRLTDYSAPTFTAQIAAQPAS